MTKFPNYLNIYNRRGGFDKWAYDMVKVGVNPKIISQAKVIVTDINKNRLSGVNVKITRNEEPTKTGTTNSNGECIFSNITEDIYHLECSKNGYIIYNELIVFSIENKSHRVTLKEGSIEKVSVTVNVTDGTSSIYDANIILTDSLGVEHTGSSTSFGSLVLDNVAIGIGSIKVTKTGYNEYNYPCTITKPSTPINIVLTPSETPIISPVTINVKEIAHDIPTPNVDVVISNDNFTHTGKTNHRGVLVFDNSVHEGNYTLKVTRNGYEEYTQPITINESSKSFDVKLTHIFIPSVTVNVKNTSGDGINGCTVSLNNFETYMYHDYTDSTGKITFTNVPSSSFSMSVSHNDYGDYSDTIDIDETHTSFNVTLSNKKVDSVTFTTKDSDGNIVDGVSLAFDNQEGKAYYGITGTDGIKIFTDEVEYGSYDLFATKEYYEETTLYRRRIDDTHKVFNLVMNREIVNPVTFTLKNSISSNPVNNATVRLVKGSDIIDTSISSETGVATFNNIPAGVYDYIITRGGYRLSKGTVTITSDSKDFTKTLESYSYAMALTFTGTEFSTNQYVDEPFTYTGEVRYTVDGGSFQDYTGGIFSVSGLSEGTHTIIFYSEITALNDQCFSNCTNLKSFEISDFITSLGFACFSGCSNLGYVNCITDTLTTIGGACFAHCSKLSTVDIFSPLLTSLPEQCFKECTSLTSINKLPIGLTSISRYCFAGCTSLTSLEGMSDKITSIGEYCFQGCTGLTSLEGMSPNLTSLGSHCFTNCTGLTSLEGLPNTLTSISEYCFANCTSLTSLEHMPSTVTSLERYCFQGCTGLESLEHIPPNLTSLPNGCFQNCTSLTSLEHMPSTITSLGDSCFDGCSSLTSLEHLPNINLLPNNCFSRCSNLTNIEDLPSTVVGLGNHCFYGCSSLTSLEGLPNSLTTLGTSCFASCTSLTNLEGFVNGITNLPVGCFAGCTSLINLDGLSNNVNSMGTSCFEGCSSLETAVLPTYVTTLNNNSCFKGCTSLNSITFGENMNKLTGMIESYSPFYGCVSITEMIFKGTTPPTCSGTSLFKSIPSGCVAKVPAGTSTAYTNALKNKGTTFEVQEEA